MKLNRKTFSVHEIILEAKDVEDWLVAQASPFFIDDWNKREVMAELKSQFEKMYKRCETKMEIILKEKKKELRRLRRDS